MWWVRDGGCEMKGKGNREIEGKRGCEAKGKKKQFGAVVDFALTKLKRLTPQ